MVAFPYFLPFFRHFASPKRAEIVRILDTIRPQIIADNVLITVRIFELFQTIGTIQKPLDFTAFFPVRYVPEIANCSHIYS